MTSCRATRPMALYTSCMAGQRPISMSSGSRSGFDAGNGRRYAHQPAGLHGPVDQCSQIGQFERLEQVLVGALLHGLDGQVGGAVAGDQDDRNAGVDRADAVERVEAGGVRQVDVEDDDVGLLFADDGEPLGGRARGTQPDVSAAERALEGVLDGRFVVDDKKCRHSPFPVGQANGEPARRRWPDSRRRACLRGLRRSAGR